MPPRFPSQDDGGTRQRFCCARCRQEFHDAARRWAIAEVDAGRLTSEQLAQAPKHALGSINAAADSQMVEPRTREAGSGCGGAGVPRQMIDWEEGETS